MALLVQKGRIALADVHGWQNELFRHTNLRLLEPSLAEMIDSTLLPLHHKDPFDRILIAQATHHALIFVTQDQVIPKYNIPHLWL
jgi:PIN domain nuclease of toxin-antitoxin system